MPTWDRNVNNLTNLPTSPITYYHEGEGFRVLQKTITGYASHPNFAGILLVGLGCELNSVDSLVDNMNLSKHSLLRHLVIQEVGGSIKSTGHGIAVVKEMLHEVNHLEREEVSANRLLIGLKGNGLGSPTCLLTNASLGKAVDRLVSQEGTGILSCTPEIYGGQELLIARSDSQRVVEKVRKRIQWWEEYVGIYGQRMDNTPNQEEENWGITTRFEKTLCSLVKGGTAKLADVYEYAERVSEKGLVFMDTPSYAPVSITGMIAGGANIICLTTKHYIPYGFAPVPPLLISAEKGEGGKSIKDIDVDCASLLDKGISTETIGERIFDLILRIASGEKVKNELVGYPDGLCTPWKLGPVL